MKSITRTALAVAGVATLAMTSAVSAGATTLQAHNSLLVRTANSTSSNWSGYASTSGPFTSVSASWTQPTGTCASARTYSSFWVGIDGDGSDSVEQTGSEVDCVSGAPKYYAWYEMYPKLPVNFTNPVRPGDHLSASVTTTGNGSFTLKIADTTEKWSHTLVKTYKPAQRFSAEIIAEAPSSFTGVLPLTNFGTIAFTNSEANGQAIGNLSAQEITMESGSTVKAQPSGLTNGEDFTDTWKHS